MGRRFRQSKNGKGTPQGDWFPDQKITVEEHFRGSFKVGKLADIAVCDRNLLKIPSSQILDMEIERPLLTEKSSKKRN